LLPPIREPVTQLSDGPKIRGQVKVDDNETSIEIDIARLADDLEIWLTNSGLRAATARERR
jgi:hypothetical protein